MQFHLKKCYICLCAVLFFSYSPAALSDTVSDAEIVFDWAEATYPHLFPNRQVTHNLYPWLYRHYPESGLYVGVNQNDEGVYVLGGSWGESPARIYSLADLLEQITSVSKSSTSSCKTVSTVINQIWVNQTGVFIKANS